MTVYPGGPQDDIKYETLSAPEGAGTINAIQNPSIETQTAPWAQWGTATLTRNTGDSVVGNSCLHVVRTSVAAGDGCISNLWPTVPNRGWSGAAYLKGTVGRAMYLSVVFFTAAFAFNGLGSSPVTTLDGTWQRMSVAAVQSPANTAYVSILASDNGTGTCTFDLDAGQLTNTVLVTDYFDGDTPGSRWLGTPYISESQRGRRAIFNDPTDVDYVGMVSFSGLDGPEIREALDDRAASDGAVQGLNFRGRRPVVGTVEIVGTSTADRNTKYQRLKRSIDALRNDGALNFTPDGGKPSTVYFRQNGPPRRDDEPGWKTTVQFPLMAADPYIYSQELKTATSSSSPWTVTCTNEGDGRATLSVDVLLGSSGPITITNQTTGKSVVLTDVNPANLISMLSKWGSVGSEPGEFAVPTGAAYDTSGNLFVVDSWNHRIQKFNSTGAYQSSFGSFGGGNGQFNSPVDIAIDSSNNIYVTDTNNYRVQKFNSAGVYQAQVGAQGTGNGQFGGGKPGETAGAGPQGIDVDASANVFVVDPGNKRVQKFTSALVYSTQFGSSGSGNGQFNTPQGIAIDSTGAPWVVDRANFRVQKFTNAATPAYASQFGTNGLGDGQFKQPYGIVLDGSNNAFVTDHQRQDVQKFTSAGAFSTRFGSYGAGDGQFNLPGHPARTGTTVAIPDIQNGRIETFGATGGGAVTFDFSAASVTAGEGLNLYEYVDVARTVWWDLAPNTNKIQLAAAGATSFTVRWRSAWL